MSQYVLIIIWIATLFLITCVVNVETETEVLNRTKSRVRIGFVVLAIIPLVWWATTRTTAFFDTGAYITSFENLPLNWGELRLFLEDVEKDKGFTVFGFIIKMIVGNDARKYLFCIALIQAGIIFSVYRKYSSNFMISLFIFIASTDYLSWMHNGIRQFTAVSLIFAGTSWMLRKKYIPLIGLILLASTFHGSALLMIPVIFIVQGEAWNKKTIMAILVFVFAIVFVDKFTNVLDFMLEETQYTNVVNDWQSGGDDGTNPIRVLVYWIPTILSVIGLRYIRFEDDPIINMACNMGIISSLLYLLSTVTSGIFIGRLPIYCSLYSMGILLPWEIENMFNFQSQKILKLGLVGCFLVFYYIQVHFIWGLI